MDYYMYVTKITGRTNIQGFEKGDYFPFHINKLKHIKDGDVLFLYESAPTRAITYKTKVLKRLGEALLDLEVLESYNESLNFTYSDLVANGMGRRVTSQKLSGELLQYITGNTLSVVTKEKAMNQRDIRSIKKKVALSQNEECFYASIIGESHPTFILENEREKYMEVHHIIPISFEKNDNYSVLELNSLWNLIALCPLCHKKLHYATKDVKKEMLKNIYDHSSVKNKIKLEELLELYNV